MPGDGWKYDWYEGSKNLITNPTFTISSASPSNTGVYHCKAKRGDFSVDSETLRVQVKDLPEARVQSEWTEAFPGEKVSLQCVIPGSQNWIYKWFKGSENVVSSDERSIKDNTLTLSVKSGHEGEYACQAELEGRTVTTAKSKTHLLTVHGSKPTVVLKQDPLYPEIYTGEQVKLICSIEEKTSKWQYQWQKHSVLVNDHTYTIPSATLDQNGEYTCTITRREMTYTESTKLNIREPPRPKLSIESQWKTFYPTEKVTLKCSIDGGSNEWGYEWFRNRIAISVDKDFSGDTLSISSAKASHSGQYTCEGKHLKRTPVTTRRAKPLQLDIYDNTPKPIITKQKWFEPFYTGEEIQLGCNMSGDGWKYDWFSNSETLITDPTFTISSASPPNTGVYHCKAKRGDFSVDSQTLRVRVQEPPQPKLSIESEWKTFYPTEKVNLKCSIDGGSNEWGYEWFRNGAQLSVDKDISFSGDTLSISSAKLSHSGQYTCKGKHLKRTPVTTGQTEALKLHIHVDTPKPHIRKDQWFEFFYIEEEVQLGCNMSGDGWEFHWYKNSKTLIAKPSYTIKSASLSDTGVYHCKAKRGAFSVDSETLQVQVQVRPPAVLSLETELSDIISGNILTLRCNVSDGRQWSYAWFENGQKLNGSSDMFKVTATEETIKSEFKCKGIRTERPLYSALSEGFTANNIILKRKILLAISGCLICCIIILIIGCLVLRFTRKPEKKETVQEDLFFSMADSKNQTASPLEEYMDNSPTEMEECEEKEELLTDCVSAVHEDDVIKDEDSPAAEANGLTSFKGL
ncbi:titin isoform X4 [Ctenopharyngodon idella]|uniref:titin isoform X2 n=1 Tax=Ctenopharyngodon idella TaxID=7959 RepID=UPI00222F338E|nr:titin isoform X2 [Ctenopharyngodon idella]XP_051735705.1 titin isoform X3 [Ctenopharyngodon idella]XP_051735707.1 titin isoform X4 [Ctenopharyngodon idella]